MCKEIIGRTVKVYNDPNTKKMFVDYGEILNVIKEINDSEFLCEIAFDDCISTNIIMYEDIILN